MSDRLGGLMVLAIGGTLQMLALCLFLIEGDMASLYLISLIFGLSQGGIVPSYAIIVREYMPPREAGRRVGVVIGATIVGMAFGGWISGAIFDLNSHALRPDGWTSADAAGLPIFPGLVTYEEVASGQIDHAIRFTSSQTRDQYVWPARHFSSDLSGSSYPPMGQRFRLKADFDISGYSPEVQVILQAMKTYGMILADNGSSWSISGAPDPRWDNVMLHEWDDVPGSAFEAVDVSSLMVDPDSGQARP